MDKESIYQLQLIDTNCNDCLFMKRDFESTNNHRESYKGTGLMDKLEYGKCSKLGKAVSFIPNTCNPNNQQCFKHRREDAKTCNT